MRISYSLPTTDLYSVGFDHVVGTRTVGYPVYFEYPGSTFRNNPVMPANTVTVSPTTTQVRMEIYRRCTLATPGNFQQCTSGTYRYEPRLGDSAVALRIPAGATANVGRIVFPTGRETYAARLGATLRSRTALAAGAFHMSLFQTTGQPHTNTGQPLDAFMAGDNVGATFDTGALWKGRYLVFASDLRDRLHPRRIKGYITLTGTNTRVIDLDAPCFGITGCTAN